jgi:hypothetical protein
VQRSPPFFGVICIFVIFFDFVSVTFHHTYSLFLFPLRSIIQHGIDVNKPSRQNVTPLGMALYLAGLPSETTSTIDLHETSHDDQKEVEIQKSLSSVESFKNASKVFGASSVLHDEGCVNHSPKTSSTKLASSLEMLTKTLSSKISSRRSSTARLQGPQSMQDERNAIVFNLMRHPDICIERSRSVCIVL